MTMTPDAALEINPAGLAQALGVSLFQTDLHMPSYRAGQVGRWRLGHGGFNLDHGYYSGPCGQYGMPILMRDEIGDGTGWETWMSLSAHEIESQELGCRYARGHTVIMGLGMGWVAINTALNPAVSKVTVIERDAEVIELFQHMHALDGLNTEALRKIRIVQADALEWQPDIPVDFLYADIWRCLEEPQTLGDVYRMQANVCAETIYFWGQELAIGALAGSPKIGRKTWQQAVQCCVTEKIGLPLLLPQDFDYPNMIAEVIRLRRSRKSPIAASSNTPQISLRPITEDDQEFLFQLYASTREEEKTLLAWEESQWQAFLQMQFSLQQSQSNQNFPAASRSIVLNESIPIGCLCVERSRLGIHVIEIALLSAYRNHGTGRYLMAQLLQEASVGGIPVTLRVQKISPAYHFYIAQGFQAVRDEGVFWLMQHVRNPIPSSSFEDTQTEELSLQTGLLA